MYIVRKRALLYLTELVTFTPLIKGEDYRTNRTEKKLKSYQSVFQGQTYVKVSVVPSMKKNPHRVVVEFSPQSDILRAACTCPAGLGLSGKGKCNHVGGVLFAIEDFTRRGLQKHAEPLSCTSRLSVGCTPQPKCCR